MMTLSSPPAPQKIHHGCCCCSHSFLRCWLRYQCICMDSSSRCWEIIETWPTPTCIIAVYSKHLEYHHSCRRRALQPAGLVSLVVNLLFPFDLLPRSIGVVHSHGKLLQPNFKLQTVYYGFFGSLHRVVSFLWTPRCVLQEWKLFRSIAR